jgi:hypothetical protein
MRPTLKAALAAAAAVLAAPSAALAATTVIDFETFPLPATSYSVSGVTFTTGAGGLLSPVDGPNGTRVVIGNVNEPNPDEFVVDTIRADFAAVMGKVSVDLGDWPSVEFGDEDLLFLEIYGAGDVYLGRTELLIGPLEPDFQTLSISGPGIKYAVFGAQSATGSSVYADNFTFDTAIPEPTTWGLMVLGFASVGAMVRRRRLARA